MTRPQAWLAPGLALTTFATLLVEILSTRLLSVLTWYHLSFLAVSLAMLGMASGAVFVFLRGERARGAAAVDLLVRAALAMAVAIPAAHICTLVIPIPPLTEARLSLILPLCVFVVLLRLPFYFSGVAVTIVLMRMHAAHRPALHMGPGGRRRPVPQRDPAAGAHQTHFRNVPPGRRPRPWEHEAFPLHHQKGGTPPTLFGRPPVFPKNSPG